MIGDSVTDLFLGWSENNGGDSIYYNYTPTKKGLTALYPLGTAKLPEDFKAEVRGYWTKEGKYVYVQTINKGTSKNIILPNGIQTIDMTAEVESVYIPASVFDISDSLHISDRYIVSADSESFTAIDGILYSKDCTALYNVPYLKHTVVLPETVSEVNLSKNNSIKTLVITSSEITSIDMSKLDGTTHALPSPFICIATQNPLGASGTHPLPESQLDRFMVKLSIGYPSCEDQMKILNANRYTNPINDIKTMGDAQSIVQVQDYLSSVRISEDVMRYAIALCEETRVHPLVELGVSPRGVIALTRMSKANALVEQRNYVVPEDVQSVYKDVCSHRLVLRPQAVVEGVSRDDVLDGILEKVKPTGQTGKGKK